MYQNQSNTAYVQRNAITAGHTSKKELINPRDRNNLQITNKNISKTSGDMNKI